jgi:hypothetical protein
MRRSAVFFGVLALQLLMSSGLLYHASLSRNIAGPRLQEKAQIVSMLGLTDLCLFTEARYTRHPSMADRNTAFQDYPFSFEHFPSGSLMPVPEIVRK